MGSRILTTPTLPPLSEVNLNRSPSTAAFLPHRKRPLVCSFVPGSMPYSLIGEGGTKASGLVSLPALALPFKLARPAALREGVPKFSASKMIEHDVMSKY